MKKALAVLNLVAIALVVNILFSEPSITGHAVAEGDLFTVSKPVKVAVVVIIITLIADVATYTAELKKKELKQFGNKIKKTVEKNIKIDITSQRSTKTSGKEDKSGKIFKISTKTSKKMHRKPKKKAGRHTKR